MKARTAMLVILALAGAGALAAVSLTRDVPEEAGNATGAPPRPSTPTAPTGPPLPPASGESPLVGHWFVYARTFGSSLVNVSVLEHPEEGHVLLHFQQVDAAGEATTWNETVRHDSREVVETTSGRAGRGSPMYDPAVGQATWVFVPRDVQAGDVVRVVGHEAEAERGEGADPPFPGTWALCPRGGCHYFDRATGAYVHWESEEEPGWTLIDTSLADLRARYGVGEGPIGE